MSHLKDNFSIQKVLDLRKEGLHPEALEILWNIADKSDEFVKQSRYARIFSSLDRSLLVDLIPIKIAILASSTDTFFREILAFWLSSVGYDASFFDSSYDSISQTILDPNSKIYSFEPDLVWIFTTYRDVRLSNELGASQNQVKKEVELAVDRFSSLWNILQERSSAYILQNNADLPPYRSYGNFDGIKHWCPLSSLRRYNDNLAAAAPEGVTIFDLEYVSSWVGKKNWFEKTNWYNSKIAFNMDAFGEVACQASRIIAAIKGKSKKCLVLDLDNTLWGGVIGDDGLKGISLGAGATGEAYVDFQKYILDLKRRGVILAVCSKNDEDKAKEPFLKHPDMQLTLEDISVFKANWDNKADNIREIATLLNIGLDSIVFIDDNPVERDLVKTFLPSVSVPTLPEDPALYRLAVDRCHYFETINITQEDGSRTNLYQENAQRVAFKKSFSDLQGYLQSLEMEAKVGLIDEFYLPRIVQLINKSNQFHLTTTRYNEKEIKAFKESENIVCRHFSLKDKFGDNGLISVVILNKQQDDRYVIDTWCMSCRVLSRGMEEYICQQLILLGVERKIKIIEGVYIPSKKNTMVADLYKRLGFSLVSTEADGTTRWELDIEKQHMNYEFHIKTWEN